MRNSCLFNGWRIWVISEQMIVAVHQPNYLPWIGFFQKVASVDVFVILDSVQYPRGASVANRNRIKTANGEQLLTVPVSIPKGSQGRISYADVQTAGVHWKKQHLKGIRMAYGRAPYFQRYYRVLERAFADTTSLLEINLNFIYFCIKELEIRAHIKLLSQLPVRPGAKSELIVNICNEIGANSYLSGQGARKYNDETLFEANGIALTYQEFECPVYAQLHGEFVPNLSIIDLLFNCGPSSGRLLTGA